MDAVSILNIEIFANRHDWLLINQFTLDLKLTLKTKLLGDFSHQPPSYDTYLDFLLIFLHNPFVFFCKFELIRVSVVVSSEALFFFLFKNKIFVYSFIFLFCQKYSFLYNISWYHLPLPPLFPVSPPPPSLPDPLPFCLSLEKRRLPRENDQIWKNKI